MALLLVILAAHATAQQVGNWLAPAPLPLTTWRCTNGSGCLEQKTSVVIDAKRHWMHVKGSTVSCALPDGTLDSKYCYDSETCHNNCVYEGMTNYSAVGVSTQNGSIELNRMVGKYTIDPRVYLLDTTGEQYEMVTLTPGMELTFEADLSKSSSSVTALYMIEMDRNGSQSEYNEAGAAYGQGYCDGACPIRSYVYGQVNTNNSGVCCSEFDIWEASYEWTKLVSHPCDFSGILATKPREKSICYVLGGGLRLMQDNGFFGPGRTVDTRKPFTVITQFLRPEDAAQSDLGAANKAHKYDLAVIRRLYIQNGKLIKKSAALGTIARDMVLTPTNVLGGLKTTNEALTRGMVFSMSIFSGPVGNQQTQVTFSNIRWGELGSTFHADGSEW